MLHAGAALLPGSVGVPVCYLEAPAPYFRNVSGSFVPALRDRIAFSAKFITQL
jgi:hypothetical protein